jgi:hypothetical protein
VDEGASPKPVLAAAAHTPFSGRLELSTASLNQSISLITRSVEDNGLAVVIQPDSAPGRVVCRVSGSRQGIDRLLTDMSAGQGMEVSRLCVDTGRFADPIIVSSATLPQVASIVRQNTPDARNQIAGNLAVLNQFAREMPGREIGAATSEKLDRTVSDWSGIPQPRLASPDKKYSNNSTPLEGEVQVKASLTIVLLSTR